MLEMVWKDCNKSLKLIVWSNQCQGIFSLASSLCGQLYVWLKQGFFQLSWYGEGIAEYYWKVKCFESVHQSATEALTGIISCE